MTPRNRKRNGGQGMKWIRTAKRLAIYLRDGLACVWCGATVEGSAKLTLDHLRPHSKGGSNHERNLVTCCHKCNSSRGSRSKKAFAQAAAGYLNHGVTAEKILRYIAATTKRKLDVPAAKALMARRGNLQRACRGGQR